MLPPDLPLAIYVEGALGELHAKMAYGVLRYSPNPVAAVIDAGNAGADVRELGLSPRSAPVVATIAEAAGLGARALVLGIAPPGGRIPPEWDAALSEAIDRGMLLVNGFHEPLAPRYGAERVWDVRQEPADLAPGTGRAAELTIPRVLTVGTDMAVGKMTTALELTKALPGARFVATGQIGIVVSGRGVPLDAVRVDFATGAVEREVLAAAEPLPLARSGGGRGWRRDSEAPGPYGADPTLETPPPPAPPTSPHGKGSVSAIFVEGQGSLVHPGSTATLPLMRGAMPTHLVLCARAGQAHLARLPHIAIPPLPELIALYESLATVSGTFPRAKVLGIALNTAHLVDRESESATRRVVEATGLPCSDPVRHGVAPFLERLHVD